MSAPTTPIEFDRAYRLPMTLWGDIRIPQELKDLVTQSAPMNALEFGCGIGRFSHYVARQGVQATGVDFSAIAIAKAQKRTARDASRPQFLVGDVTDLAALSGPFDVSFDIGCFHCLDMRGQRDYVAEVSRLLNPHGTHLIWALDVAPCGMRLSPAIMSEIFGAGFALMKARASRRRFAPSHWYWLVSRKAA